MISHSILFETTEDRVHTETLKAPAFFADLNLDQVISTVTAGREEYHLLPFFYTPLRNIDSILYRQGIFRDLENRRLFEAIQAFARNMHTMRTYLAQADKLHYSYQKKRWFLDAVEIYCEAVQGLVQGLSNVEVHSRGFLAMRDYVTGYAQTDRFTSLQAETKELQAGLSTVRYCLLIKANSILVRPYASEPDYSREVAETFEKFKQGAVKDYRVKFSDWQDMNHIEAHILDLVARLYPDLFAHLDRYCTNNHAYLNETIAAFDREIQFYLAYLEYIARFKRKGLPFCYPQLSTTSKEIDEHEAFDLALASKLVSENTPVVCNDFFLKGEERVFVVTGPNQGGKTTFARMCGQVHYLASLGCPVPGKKAQLFLVDQIFTHFEKEETITDLRGKLQDDLARMYTILNQATSNSLIILNEIFTSTTVSDALFLSKKILEKILQMDALGVCVTFIDELASLSEKTVSMVSTIIPDNPALRTFKIVRKSADGLAYALAIAERYRLTYECLKERIPS
ncbi:MAG TPA: hypothetical protein VKV19_20005 [Ktedonobacteraceae bacterium]|nr:hypothetical protein [Ktedonobacteraceae bacterium]